MGIYYGAIDYSAKEKICSPGHFANKFPGICHPHNPFPGMVVMMNARGSSFDIVNDGAWGCPYDSDEYKNITDEVYKKYLEMFPWAKEFYEEEDK